MLKYISFYKDYAIAIKARVNSLALENQL